MSKPSVAERLKALPAHACDETTWRELAAIRAEVEAVAREMRDAAENGPDSYAFLNAVADRLAGSDDQISR